MTPDGAELAHGRAPTRWRQTVDGTEADAYEIADAAQRALAAAVTQVPDAQVIAVGVASMAEAGVLVDRDEVLGPVIAWHDERDRAELDRLDVDLGRSTFSRTTGLPWWTQWSLTKHRWLTDHGAEAARATRRYSIAEWVVRSLGGDPGSDLSLTSRTGWLRLQTRDLWHDSLEWSGASPDLLRELVPSGTPSGQVPADHPVGALHGAVLTVAGHDHQAAAVGVGAIADGDQLDSCGTAEALVRTARPGLDPEVVAHLAGQGITVGWHALPERWCLLGATQGGLELDRTLAELGVDRDGLPDLDRAASLGPEGHPGMPGAMWRAATRQVAAQVRDLDARISAAAGPHAEVVVTGGWAHSAAVMAAKEDALGPVVRPEVVEAGARGAALLAGLAGGTYTTLEEFPPPHTERREPHAPGHHR